MLVNIFADSVSTEFATDAKRSPPSLASLQVGQGGDFRHYNTSVCAAQLRQYFGPGGAYGREVSEPCVIDTRVSDLGKSSVRAPSQQLISRYISLCIMSF